MRKLAKWIKHQNQKNVPEYEVVIQETVKNWYKNVINQESGDSWLASHMVNHGLPQSCVKDTMMIPKWLITRWWNSTVHANSVNSLERKHSSILTDSDLKTNTFSSLTVHSSPLLSSLYPMHLSTFSWSPSWDVLTQLPTFQRNMEAQPKIFIHQLMHKWLS
jgi:hypothetical protein